MSEDVPPKTLPAVLIRPLPIILGFLAGLGVAVLLQQYAVTLLTLPLLIGLGIAGGALIGIGLPTLFMYTMRPKTADPVEEEADQ